jgi:hypothetical protein
MLFGLRIRTRFGVRHSVFGYLQFRVIGWILPVCQLSVLGFQLYRCIQCLWDSGEACENVGFVYGVLGAI